LHLFFGEIFIRLVARRYSKALRFMLFIRIFDLRRIWTLSIQLQSYIVYPLHFGVPNNLRNLKPSGLIIMKFVFSSKWFLNEARFLESTSGLILNKLNSPIGHQKLSIDTRQSIVMTRNGIWITKIRATSKLNPQVKIDGHHMYPKMNTQWGFEISISLKRVWILLFFESRSNNAIDFF
jgi:hypothetical protein